MSKFVDNIVKHLSHAAQVHKKLESENRLERLVELRDWQCKRLLATHDELWQEERFKPAMTFFINELYGPKDFSKRDEDIARVVPKMEKWLPAEALESLEVAIHLNSLSQDLDVALLNNLNDGPIDSANYAQAYKASNNPKERAMQIDYIENLGLDLARVVKIPGISMILVVARKPAQMAGLSELQEFLEAGFGAFKQLGKVEDFIVPIVSEERNVMTGLFKGDPVLTLP